MPKKKAEDSAGADLELRVGRIEFAEGAFVRLQVPVILPGDPGRDVMTDIDVLSLDFDSRLREARSIHECKSSRGQAGEIDRLLWLRGLAEFLPVARGVLVRETVTERGRHVAERIGVETFDTATLERREAECAWVPNSFAHLGGVACAKAEKRATTQLKGLGEFPPRLAQVLRHELPLLSDFKILSAIVALDGTVRKMAILPDPAGLVLSSHAFIGLVLAALRSASLFDSTPVPNVKRRIETALVTGDPTDTQVLSVLSMADALFRTQADAIHQAYVEKGAERLTVPMQSARDQVTQLPDWIDRYVDLCERLRANPGTARELPQTLELACFDAFVEDRNWEAEAFSHLFTPEHRQLIAVAHEVFQRMVEPLASRLEGLLSLPFDRSPPALPDRRTPYEGTVSNSEASKLQLDLDKSGNGTSGS